MNPNRQRIEKLQTTLRQSEVHYQNMIKRGSNYQIFTCMSIPLLSIPFIMMALRDTASPGLRIVCVIFAATMLIFCGLQFKHFAYPHVKTALKEVREQLQAIDEAMLICDLSEQNTAFERILDHEFDALYTFLQGKSLTQSYIEKLFLRK